MTEVGPTGPELSSARKNVPWLSDTLIIIGSSNYWMSFKLELKSFASATKVEGCHFSVEPINRLLVLLNRITLNCSAVATGIGAASSRWGLSHRRRGVALLVLVVAAVGLVGLVWFTMPYRPEHKARFVAFANCHRQARDAWHEVSLQGAEHLRAFLDLSSAARKRALNQSRVNHLDSKSSQIAQNAYQYLYSLKRNC